MKTYASIRELLYGTPPVDHGSTEAERRAGMALPGDGVEVVMNPYASRNPQTVLALVRAGTLSPEHDALAREALTLFEGFSGGDRVSGCLTPRKRRTLDGSGVLPDVAANPDRHPVLEDVFRSMLAD